ncbi:hypothetical protein ACTFIT_008329 [Dictyostelium discoideum]
MQYYFNRTTPYIPKHYFTNFYCGALEYIYQNQYKKSYDLNLDILAETIFSKNIKYRSIINKRNPQLNNTHTNSFILFSICNENNKQIESIKIYRYFVEPFSLVSIKKFEKLHTLVIPTQFHHLIGLSLDKDDACCIGVKKFTSIFINGVTDYFQSMIKSLNSSKSLRNLTNKNCDLNYGDDKFQSFLNDIKPFSNGNKSFLSSTSSTSGIEYFKIKNFGILISNDTFSELNNKSIKTLVLDDDCIFTFSKPYQFQFYRNHHYNIIQYLFENIFNKELSIIKYFKFSLAHTYYEIINLSNKIQQQQQQQQQQSKNLIEFKIYVRMYQCRYDFKKNEKIKQYQSLLNYKIYNNGKSNCQFAISIKNHLDRDLLLKSIYD